jgi:hypothetical protein
MDTKLVDYQVTVYMNGDIKHYDVRSQNEKECEKDIRSVLTNHGLTDIKINIAPHARFQIKG